MGATFGRTAEVAAILAALQRPDLAGVVLVGDAGAGKTHLLSHALDLADGAGFTTARLAGTRALADLPLAAFTPMLPDHPRGDASDLVWLRDSLRRLASGRSLVLGVDDAHLLDDASAAVVHQLAGDLTAFVIATVRAGEVPPEDVTALWKDRLAERIVIGPLERDAIGHLGRTAFGAPLEPDVTDEVWRRSAGNPLFARELFRAAGDEGTLVVRDGLVTQVASLPSPASIGELLGNRLRALDPDERRAVELIAVGGDLDVDVLEDLVDPDALVRLEAARILVADQRQDRLEVHFEHPLHADAVRATIGQLAARRVRRELADALEARGRASTDDVLRIVTLRLDSSGSSSPALLARAARIALRRNDPALTERLAAATFAGEPTLATATVLATALSAQGRAAEAFDAITDHRIDRAGAGDDDLARGDLLEGNLRFWGLGDAAAALAILTDRRPADPRWALRFDGAAAAVEACRGNPEAALRLAPPGGEVAATGYGALAVVVALATSGRPAAALAAVQPPAEHAGVIAEITAVNLAFALVDAGRIEEAGTLAIERWERAAQSGALHARVGWSLALGWSETFQGRMLAARRWFEEAARLAPLSAAGSYGRRWGIGGALFSATQLGDLEGGRALATQLESCPPHDAVVHDLLGRRGRAWLQHLEGDLPAAMRTLLTGARATTAAGRHTHAIQLLADAARLGQAGRARAALGRVDLDGALLPTLAESIGALADGDAERLGAAADRLHELGAVVLAAEAANAAWSLARGQDVDPRVVASLQRRAQELTTPLGQLATPGLAARPADIPLSRREREIAVLVSEGRTSREVAATLIIGLRTVESHLARVYDKLGIRSRSELGAALGMIGASS